MRFSTIGSKSYLPTCALGLDEKLLAWALRHPVPLADFRVIVTLFADTAHFMRESDVRRKSSQTSEGLSFLIEPNVATIGV